MQVRDTEQRFARPRALLANAHKVRRRRESAESLLLAGARPGARGHRLVATRSESAPINSESAPINGLVVAQHKGAVKGARFGSLCSQNVAHSSKNGQCHPCAGGSWATCAPVALRHAGTIGTARDCTARETGCCQLHATERGYESGPRLNHELGLSRWCLRAEERLIATSCPSGPRRNLFAVPGSERLKAAVDVLGCDLHVRNREGAAVVRAHGSGKNVAVPVEQAHVKDRLAPSWCEGIGAAIRDHPMIRHPAIGRAR